MTTDDHWAHLEKRPAPETDALLQADAALGLDWANPVSMAQLFVSALVSLDDYPLAPGQLVHPHTVPAWGDFAEMARSFKEIPDAGIGSTPNFPDGWSTVAYVKILSHVTETFVVETEQLIMVAGVFTMVRWPSQGRWVVFGFGDPVAPELIPPLD